MRKLFFRLAIVFGLSIVGSTLLQVATVVPAHAAGDIGAVKI